MIKQVSHNFGHLDILVNNAGIGRFGPLETFPTDQWDLVMSTNARSVFLMCRETLPLLKLRTPSFIINISSVVGDKGYANQSAYSASKHAIMGLTKAFAKEVAEYGIRVHAICPGGVSTDLVTRARPDIDSKDLMTPQDIADIVLFLVTRKGNGVIDQISVRRLASTPWV